MKPFNLESALKGAKVVTRDGRPVKIAGKIITGENESIFDSNKKILGLIGVGVKCSIIYEKIHHWDENGRTYTYQETQNDLFMAPTERKEWIVRCPEYKVVGPFHDKGLAEHWKESQNRQDATIHEITIIE